MLKNMVGEEVQKSAVGVYSLTRKMWCYLNMKTNELSHVQYCSILPALIPICHSGQQAWIDYSA